jgi:hypothetical protein
MTTMPSVVMATSVSTNSAVKKVSFSAAPVVSTL